MDSGIAINEVSFSFRPGAKVLQDVNLFFRPGEFVGLVGPNASGKTTLARLLNGNLLPSRGRVSIDGISSALPQNHTLLKRLVALIRADAENQLITPTVWDELMFGLQSLPMSADEAFERAERALENFGLIPYRDAHPFYLSVGEQFRLLLAASFVRQPRYFVLDEVMSVLDGPTRNMMNEQLLSLRSSCNVGVILLTHRLDDLIDADRIVVMQHGQVQMDDSVVSVFRAAMNTAEWNIDVPLTYRMHETLRRGNENS